MQNIVAKTYPAVLAVLIMAATPNHLAAQKIEDDPVISVRDTNKEMARAISRARETLPVFFELMKSPRSGQTGFSLKVGISDSRNTEHFWLGSIVRDGNGFVGTINNTPRSVTHVKAGQRFRFPQKDISDWMYRQNGKIYGGYTIRVLVKMISPDQRAKLKAMLAYEPD